MPANTIRSRRRSSCSPLRNPIEQEGTYPLPEAQLDRFMFNTWVDYPTYAEELSVVKATTADAVATVNAVITGEEIAHFQQLIRRMPIADNVLEYAVGLVGKTRPGRERATDDVNAYLSWGAGPRASQYLVVGAKVNAALNGKYSPDIEDVRAVATPILRHRIVRNYKAEAEGHTVERIIEGLLARWGRLKHDSTDSIIQATAQVHYLLAFCGPLFPASSSKLGFLGLPHSSACSCACSERPSAPAWSSSPV